MRGFISSFIIGVGVVICFAVSCFASPYAFETLTVTSSTAVGFTAANVATRATTHSGPNKATVTCESYDVRFRFDGSNPTYTVGHKLLENSVLSVLGAKDIQTIRFISCEQGSASCQVTYE